MKWSELKPTGWTFRRCIEVDSSWPKVLIPTMEVEYSKKWSHYVCVRFKFWHFAYMLLMNLGKQGRTT